MFCSQCGIQNEEGVRFCENCGQLLTGGAQDQQPIQQVPQQFPPGNGAPPVSSASQYYTATQTPPVNYSFYGQVGTQNSALAAQRPKRPIKPAFIIVGAAALVLIIVCIVLFNVGAHVASPRNVALNAFRNIYSGDYATLYNAVDITPGDFTGKSTFEKIMKKTADTQKLGKLLSCSVVSDKESTKDKKSIETVTIKYTMSSESGSQTTSIALIKQSGKKWLFYDDWKISSDGLVAGSYTVYAPKGATVNFDNVKVSSKYLSKGSNPTNNPQNYFDEYVLKNVLNGENDLKITSPYANDITDTVNVSDGDSYTPSSIKLSDSAAKLMSTTAQDDLGKLYTAAISGNDFSSVKSLFSTDTQAQNNGENSFSQLSDDLNYYYSYEKLESVTFSNVDISNAEVQSDGSIYAGVGFDYVYTLNVTDYYGGTSEFTQTNPQSYSTDMQFVYDNGKWDISYIGNIYFDFPQN